MHYQSLYNGTVIVHAVVESVYSCTVIALALLASIYNGTVIAHVLLTSIYNGPIGPLWHGPEFQMMYGTETDNGHPTAWGVPIHYRLRDWPI